MKKCYLSKIFTVLIVSCLLNVDSIAQDFNVTTTVQCNTTTGGSETVNFTTATPNAIGDGTLTLYYNGDLSVSEYIDFFGESSSSTPIGTATNGSSQCGTNYDSMVLTIPMADINAWAADGTISILADAASSVNNICTGGSSFCVYMKLHYPRASGLNDIGVPSIDTPGVFCAGPQNIWVRVQNYGINQVNNFTVNWAWNGVAQTPLNVNQLLDTAQGSSPNNIQLMLGTKTISDADTIVVWTSNPNGGMDTTNLNDTITKIFAPSLAGAYTINASMASSATNYTSFTSLVNDLAQYGICGPVTVDVTGTYNEQVTISQIPGSSSVNTIVFNGYGDTLTHAGTSTNYATLRLDGADYITFNNLVIQTTGATSGYAVHLSNAADGNTFDSCVILASTTATGTASCAVVMSGSPTSYSTSGANGSNNTFSYCEVVGGYFGVVFYGNTASSNVNNSVLNCSIKDFYVYGSYNLQQSGATIANNVIERPTRASVSTLYGVMLTTGCNNMLVERNIIRNAGGSTGTASFTAYPIYNSAAASTGNENKIYNNLIYNIGNQGTVGGIYMPSGTYVKVYHNTIALSNTSATSGTVYGIYSTGTAGVDLKNNNIFITQGGSGVKYGLYFSGAGKTSDHNNIYVNSAGGQNNTGYYSTAIPSLSAWQAVNGSAWDQNSIDVNPLFTNLATGNLTPANGLLDDLGTPVGITTDFYGLARSTTTPDIGAIEFSVPPCSGTPTPGTATAVNNITSACANGQVDISLSGFSSGGGIMIQWEESPTGAGMWTPIAGATTSSLTDTLLSATDYRAVITCANGGAFDVSNTVSIGVNPFYVCYCSPLTGTTLHTSTSNYVTNVSIPNTTLNSTTSAVGPGGYTQTNHTISSNTATLAQGVSYSIEVITSSSSANSEVWIDWDQSGSFDSTEHITLSGTGTLDSATFTVPLTAPTGLTGLRVRNVFSSTTFFGPTGACNTISVGRETEDYVITIAPAPSCFPPGTPAATAVLATSGTFEWTQSSSSPANGYEWRVFTAGNGPTGTPVASGTEPAGDTIASPTGLAAITNYTFYVRAACGAGGNSLWASVNFTTPCAAYNAPWFDSVESQTANTTSTMTNCWSSNPSNQSSVLAWHVTGNGTTSSSSTGPSYANSGQKYFFLETSYGSTGGSAELFSPQVNVSTLTAPMLEFYYHMYGATTNKLVVSVHNGSTWNDVDSIIGQQQTSETAPWIKRSIYLTGYTGVIQVKFTAYRGSSFTGDISIDDISVMQAPSCPAPTGPSATTTMTSASLNWTENGTATLWQIEYGNSSFAQGTGTSVFTTTKPYTLSPLTHSTAYSYFVRSICGPNDTSAWSSRKTFATIPDNDTCANAINIGGGASTAGTTAGATQSMPAGTCATTTTYANDVWYYFSVGSTPGTVTITATNTVGDVVLEVLSGTCGSMTELDCEDAPAIGTETITLSNLAPGIYYVRVYGYLSIENPFTVQVTGTPLAIHLLELNATQVGGKNRIDWKTADEAKGDRFTIERSADGRSFSSLGTVAANGLASSYTYWDEQPVAGNNHYRLKMTDVSGNTTYSGTVLVVNEVSTEFAVEAYPNPFDGQTSVKITGVIAADASLTVTDLSGKIVRRIENVKAETVLDLNGMATGVYMVKYQDAAHTRTVRIHKK